MASVQTSSYEGRYLKLTVVEESYSIANNTSTVRWTLESIGGDVNYYTIFNWGVWVNGQQIYGTQTTKWDSKSFPASKGSTTGTITVNHNADGSAGAVGFTLKGSVYTSLDKSYTGSISLTKIPRQANLTSAPDFNDEANPTINYSNPAGNSVGTLCACISLTGAKDDVPYRDVSKTGTSYTFNLTTAERNTLRNACPNSNSLNVTFYLRTVISGNTYYSTITKKMTIVNGNPTFSTSNVSYKDNNSTTTAVTGNNQQLVQNLSSLLVTITGATALKGASISKYEATINGVTKSITSAGNIDFGVINSGTNLTLTVKVTDSRGNTTSCNKTVTFLAWVLPSAVISLKRKNNYEDETYLKVQASYSSVNSKNTITIKYQYKKTTETNYSALTTINNNTQVTISKDKASAWNFKITVTDKFGTVTYNSVLAKGQFIFFVDTKKLSVGVNCFPKNNESLEVNGEKIGAIDFSKIYPVGSIYMSVNSTNPGTLFGGTWTQISDKFLYCTTSGAKETGGQSSVSYTPAGSVGGHTLTLSEIPSHSHVATTRTTSYGAGTQSSWRCMSFSGTNSDYAQTINTGSSGGGGSHNHGFTGTKATIATMPPYMKVYAWYRTG